MKNILILVAFVFANMACQQKPTKALSTEPLFLSAKAQKAVAEVIKLNPIFVDVRSPFDFGLSKVPGSVNIQWQDFYVKVTNGRYLLNQDSYAVARRLSTLGISPDRETVVLSTESTKLQAYHVAWLMRRWGVVKTHVIDAESLRALNITASLPTKNAEMWLPNVNKYMYIDGDLWRIINGQTKVSNSAPRDWRGISIQVAFFNYCLVALGAETNEVNFKQFSHVVKLDEKMSLDNQVESVKTALKKETKGCLIHGGGASVKESLAYVLNEVDGREFIPVYGE